MTFPDLPAIRDPQLRQKVFTHKGFFGLPTGRETDPDPQDNERLALLGASIISACVTFILYKDYPQHRKAYLATKRSSYIEEKRLHDWAKKYGLASQLRCHPSQELLVRSQPKTQASLFEAYAGAVFIEGGFPAIEAWFTQLINDADEEGDVETTAAPSSPKSTTGILPEATDPVQLLDLPVPTVHDSDTRPEPETPTPGHASIPPSAPSQSSPGMANPLSYFNEKASQRRARVEWRETPHGAEHNRQWTITAVVDGVPVGTGFHQTKKQAKHVAAQQALQRLGW